MQGADAYEMGQSDATTKICGLWSRMSGEQKLYWELETRRVQKRGAQALDPEILQKYLGDKARRLTAQFSVLGEEWKEIKRVRLQAYGSYGFQEIPMHAESYDDLLGRSNAAGDIVVIRREEAIPTPQDLTISAGDGTFFEYHRVRAPGGYAASEDRPSLPRENITKWADSSARESNFWIWQGVQLLLALTKRSSGALVYLRTQITLQRLAIFGRVSASYESHLPPFVAPEVTDAAENELKTTVPERQAQTPTGQPKEERVQPDIVTADAAAENQQAAPSAIVENRQHLSATPILDLLFGGNVALTRAEKLVEEVCRGMARRTQEYKRMNLEGRHCGLRINFHSRSKTAIGIRQRLWINSTRPQLPENDQVNRLSREQFCEWLLKPQVAWNRKACAELKNVEITMAEDKFGGPGMYQSIIETLGLTIPRNLLVFG